MPSPSRPSSSACASNAPRAPIPYHSTSPLFHRLLRCSFLIVSSIFSTTHHPYAHRFLLPHECRLARSRDPHDLQHKIITQDGTRSWPTPLLHPCSHAK